jgi:large conductance mechanosensitive channel
MLKGFKDFIMRGNVVDLAVGIVIGAAFTAVVTAFTGAFLKPIIQLVSGGEGVTAGAFRVRGVPFDWASFINACITFLITAAAIYFLVVLPLNRLAERRARGEEPPPAAPSEEVKLLTEIRDALVTGRAAPGAVNDAVVRNQQQQAPRQY